jgi:hypothetical protein
MQGMCLSCDVLADIVPHQYCAWDDEELVDNR